MNPVTSPFLRQRGITLIEVLVTVVVLAFGLLGLAGLLTKTISLAGGSYMRSVVTERIYSMADRMRLNHAGVQAGNYDNFTSAVGSPTSCTACSAADMANMDFNNWSTELSTMLPSGTGIVTGDGKGTGIFTITVKWTDPRLPLDQQPQQYSIQVQP